ncbi:MAG TPA: aminomethyl transferase family protein [Pseudolysinimonas sp.]|nr:aminomethyl transferase family protein [Pseudolysinimonas sp.]
MTHRTIQDLLSSAPDPVRALRSVPFTLPLVIDGLTPQFTNWRSEQSAWHDSAALMDQSHHMYDLFVSGPDAEKALSRLAVNSFVGFAPGTAKQFIATNADGHMIGDGILIRHGEQDFQLIADVPVSVWTQYHLEHGDDDLTLVVDPSTPFRDGGNPVHYRYEIQGPNALAILAAATGAEIPPTRFFHVAEMTIAGHTVRGLRHGMAGKPGFELFGPWEEGPEVWAAIAAAGEAHDLHEVGFLAYWTANLESGWFGNEVPAFYSGTGTEGFREWAPADIVGSLGGSFDSENIEDYYVTPFDIGYANFVAFDHEFIGREALEAIADTPPALQKVALVWNDEDFANVFGSMLRPEEGLAPQPIDINDAGFSAYALTHYDSLLVDGQHVGYSVQYAYLAPHRSFVSLAAIAPEHAEPGTEVILLWGDSLTIPRDNVEPHRQVQIRATVAPSPFDSFARDRYRK